MKNVAKYVPDATSFLRGGISLIPYVGGSFNELIFGKAERIRIDNIEIALDEIKNKMETIEEEKIDKEWFSKNPESIEMFIKIGEIVQFKKNINDVKFFANFFVTAGLTDFSKDPNKFAVLNRINELTLVQRRILSITSNTKPEERVFRASTMKTTETAIWIESIADKINHGDTFWEGELNLPIELEYISSLGLVRISTNPVSTLGYRNTGIGLSASKYIQNSL